MRREGGREGRYLGIRLGGTREGSDSSSRLHWLDLIDQARRFEAPPLSAVIDLGIDSQISSKKKSSNGL